jgi:hypothetical protein
MLRKISSRFTGNPFAPEKSGTKKSVLSPVGVVTGFKPKLRAMIAGYDHSVFVMAPL